jgi:hypothetical protein
MSMENIEELEQQKNNAYLERNQLVAALSKIYPAWLGRHIGVDWDAEWRNIVFIEIPTEELFAKYCQGGFIRKMTRQVSWHIHDNDLRFFRHLRFGTKVWDGHTTKEKYNRLSQIRKKTFFERIFNK